MDQDDLSGKQRLQAIQGIPAGEGGTGKRARFEIVEVLRALNQAILVEDTILTQSTVDDTTKTRVGGNGIHRSILVLLVEQGSHFVSLFEQGDLASNLNNLASTVRARDHRKIQRERVHSLLDVLADGHGASLVTNGDDLNK